MEKLSPSALLEIDTIVAKHRNQPGPVIEMLHEVQNSLGYIPFEAMEKIAEAAGTSPAQVYGVVTFYAQFTTQPKGKHVINVCLGTACYVNGSQKLADLLASGTGASINETSQDGLFSLDATRCLGACGLAPVCIIDGKVYGNALVSGNAVKRIEEIKAQEAAHG
ncbi:MAG: NAD(P)H-dependent oxidoreductase subunit E [Lactimicrobium sp.]|jgi:NADH:ubiquinone oxidoreductase subunit E|uniref:NADH-quinone oxidoreductase subunit NuoE family protein n=1 Tax=Lactimicrobium sp. TaxID=2563780 RepID=UPI002F353646